MDTIGVWMICVGWWLFKSCRWQMRCGIFCECCGVDVCGVLVRGKIVSSRWVYSSLRVVEFFYEVFFLSFSEIGWHICKDGGHGH